MKLKVGEERIDEGKREKEGMRERGGEGERGRESRRRRRRMNCPRITQREI